MLETALYMLDVKFRFLNFYDIMCKPRIPSHHCLDNYFAADIHPLINIDKSMSKYFQKGHLLPAKM